MSTDTEPLIVIGIAGIARSGKDSAARALTLYRHCERIALADGVKSALRDLGDEYLKDLSVPGISPRTVWQILGTEAREAAGCPDVWLDLLATKIVYASLLHYRPRRRFVVPDIRYPCEVTGLADRIAGIGGTYATLLLTRAAAGPAGSHFSESEVRKIVPDCSYANDGSIESLAAAARGFFDATLARALARRPTHAPATDTTTGD